MLHRGRALPNPNLDAMKGSASRKVDGGSEGADFRVIKLTTRELMHHSRKSTEMFTEAATTAEWHGERI
jgi:hypothetical protein